MGRNGVSRDAAAMERGLDRIGGSAAEEWDPARTPSIKSWRDLHHAKELPRRCARVGLREAGIVHSAVALDEVLSPRYRDEHSCSEG